MYCTQYNITSKIPKTDSNKVTGKYLKFPISSVKRISEGGLRTTNKFKTFSAKKLLLTIITVVFNNVKTLERCILSVLKQNYDNVEFIIIDGGSTDGTLDIIKKYEDAIDYYISEPDEGLYFAMNKGLSLATGNIINFMNSDDYFNENVFSKYVEKLLDKHVLAVRANLMVIDLNGKIIHKINTKLEDLFFDSRVCHQTYFIRTEGFEQQGYFNTKYKISADYDLLLHIYIKNYNRFSIINFNTVYYSVGGVSDLNKSRLTLEKVQIQWECFGKTLGIPKEFFNVLSSNTEIAKSKVLSQLFALYKNFSESKVISATKNKNLANKQQLFDHVFQSFCCFLENNLHKEYLNLEQNFWYRLGQLPKKEKPMALIKKLLKRN